jgi:hypothetical protein
MSRQPAASQPNAADGAMLRVQTFCFGVGGTRAGMTVMVFSCGERARAFYPGEQEDFAALNCWPLPSPVRACATHSGCDVVAT